MRKGVTVSKRKMRSISESKGRLENGGIRRERKGGKRPVPGNIRRRKAGSLILERTARTNKEKSKVEAV